MLRQEHTTLLVLTLCYLGLCWTASADELHGDLLISTGESRVIDGLDVYGSIDSHGTVMISVNPQLWAEQHFRNSGAIRMYKSTCWGNAGVHNLTTGAIRGFGMIGSNQLIENAGRIESLGGSLTLITLADFSNHGTLATNPGTTLTVIAQTPQVSNHGTIRAVLSASVVVNVNLLNESDGAIELIGGTISAKSITQRANARFEGFGGIVGDVVVDPNALMCLTGSTQIVGNLHVAKGAVFNIRRGTTYVTGEVICEGGTIMIEEGDLIAVGGVTE